MRAASSGTIRTSARRIPCSFIHAATWATFLSWVRPDRISSPITTRAAVQVFGLSSTSPPVDFASPNAYLAAMTQYITVAADDRVEARNGVIKLHGPEGFEGMRAAGRLAAEILDALAAHVVPGVSTEQLDDIVHQMTLDTGELLATLRYRGFTKSSCISIHHLV